MSDYYDVGLKRARISELEKFGTFEFIEGDLIDRSLVASSFAKRPDRVIHLAAQAGVRYSVTHPEAYIDANLVGFANVLEASRRAQVAHFTYASSSSVYGGNARLPFSEHHAVNHPVSLYAATKKANELMAHSYSHLFGLPSTGLRFFTVYGPWGRPDMALFLFTRALFAGEPVELFNEGRMVRDFTYIDDIVEGVVRVSDRAPQADADFDRQNPDPARSSAPYRIFNIGNSQPTPLIEYIEALEAATGRTLKKTLAPMQPGDVEATSADTSELEAWVGFRPRTPVKVGVAHFVRWYRDYYGV